MKTTAKKTAAKKPAAKKPPAKKAAAKKPAAKKKATAKKAATKALRKARIVGGGTAGLFGDERGGQKPRRPPKKPSL